MFSFVFSNVVMMNTIKPVKISKILNFRKSEFKTCCICHQNIENSKLNGQLPLDN